METEIPSQGSSRYAYLVACLEIIDPEALRAYAEIKAPLGEERGLVMLAKGQLGRDIRLLAGELPYSGQLVIERFDSMRKLMDFWRSEVFSEARKILEKSTTIHFMVALDGEALPITGF